jgi:uncharacterized protein (TIGR03437 family)
MIDTIAGGAGEGAPARAASFDTLIAVARDTQGRGVYVADLTDDATLIRFINTSASDVTLGGRTIRAGTVRTIAGAAGGDFTNENIPGLRVDVGKAYGLGVSPDGNLVYYIDQDAGKVRGVNVSGGSVSFGGQSIGSGNVGTLAAIANSTLIGLATHPSNGEVYVSDAAQGVNKVYRITMAGAVATVAGNGANTAPSDPFPGGTATNVPLLTPRGVGFDASANLIIADSGHYRVIRVSGGNATLVNQFNLIQLPDGNPLNPYPSDVALVIGNGNLYTANGNEQAIYRLTNGVAKLAGRTTGSPPKPTACDYSTDNCGDGGAVGGAGFNMLGSTDDPPITGLENDQNGLFVIDQKGKGRLRYINLSTAPVTLAGTQIAAGAIDTIAGSGLEFPYNGGQAIGAAFSSPTGVAIDGSDNLWISDTNNDQVRFFNRGSSQVTLFPGTPAQQSVPAGGIVAVNQTTGVGALEGPVNQATFAKPQGLFVTNQGVYVVDSIRGPAVPQQTGPKTSLIRFFNTTASNVTIFPGAGGNAITVPPGEIRTVGGAHPLDDGTSPPELVSGFARAVSFKGSSDIVVAGNGTIYVTDVVRKAVRKIDGSSGQVTAVNLPASKEYTGLGFTSTGQLLVANFTDGQVHRESSAGSGTFSTIPNVGTSLANVRDVAGGAGGVVFATIGPVSSTSGSHRIVQIQSTGGVAATLAGATPGFAGDGGAAAGGLVNLAPDPLVSKTSPPQISSPQTVGIAVSQAGEIIFTDTRNNRIRSISGISCVKSGTITITGPAETPVLSSINPNSAPANGPAFTLTANGSKFTTSSVVRWNGQNRPTTYQSATVLTADIPASDLVTAGPAQVTIFTPQAPAPGTSGALTFMVQGPPPKPMITGINPTSKPQGSQGFDLTVNGTGFVNSSQVQFGGISRLTTFVSSTQLTGKIEQGDLIDTGTVPVTVSTPPFNGQGGGTSNSVDFTITAPVCSATPTNPAAPTVNGLNPPAVGIGHRAFPSFKLYVSGTNFFPTSKVRVNGVEVTTTCFTGTMMMATVPGSAIPATVPAGGSNLPITINTPGNPGGGGTSAAFNLRVMPDFNTASAASFGKPLAPDMIVAGFGGGMKNGAPESANQIPLPTDIGGTSVQVVDSGGAARDAGLFFASAGQINYQVPPMTAEGIATAIVKVNGSVVVAGALEVVRVVPSLFTFNGSLVAGYVLRNRGGNILTEEIFAIQGQSIVPNPINLGPGTENDIVFLIMYGTGMTNATAPISVDFNNGAFTKNLDPNNFEGIFPTAFIGLNQVNIFLPRAQMPNGLINLKLTMNGRTANTVQIQVQK